MAGIDHFELFHRGSITFAHMEDFYAKRIHRVEKTYRQKNIDKALDLTADLLSRRDFPLAYKASIFFSFASCHWLEAASAYPSFLCHMKCEAERCRQIERQFNFVPNISIKSHSTSPILYPILKS
jgi:hypothetical protein